MNPLRATWRVGNLGRCLASTLLLAGATATAAPPEFFPIATGSVAMSYATDGTHYLVGIENRDTSPPILGAQMFSSSGTRVGDFISTGRTGLATALAFDGTNYLLIWEDDGLGTLNDTTGWQVYGQFISPTGRTVGAPFAISTRGIWFDGIKPMAFGGDAFLVTYTRLIDPARGDHSDNRYIAGRIVERNGALGAEARISTGFGKESDVAFDGTNFFVVWCEDRNDTEIRGRFVSPQGTPGTEISVNASAAPSDNPKSVAFDGTKYLVVWNDESGGKETGTWDVFGQFVSPNGTLVGGVIPISTEPGPEMVTSVASDGANFLAVWADMSNLQNWNAYGRFISGGGVVYTQKLTLSTEPTNQLPMVGFANGRYLVAIANGILMDEDGVASVGTTVAGLLTPWGPPVLVVDKELGVEQGHFGFRIQGGVGQTIVIEACNDLARPVWESLETLTLDSESAYYSDPSPADLPTRTYRLRTP